MAFDGRVRSSLTLVVALVMGLIIIAAVLPVAMDAFYEDKSQQLTQDESETYQVAGLIETNATDVNTVDGEATIELNRSGTTASNTVANGTTTTYTVDGHDVNVTVNDVSSGTPNTATVTYEYSADAAWNGNTGDLYYLIPLFVMIGLVIVILIRSLDWM